MNKYYSYDNMNLWDNESWGNRQDCLAPVAKWIQLKNLEDDVPWSDEKYAGMTDMLFDPKTNNIFYQSIVDYWKNKGLTIRFQEMGGRCWVALVPNEMIGKWENKPNILVVFAEGGKTDQNWSLKLFERYKHYNEAAAKEGFMIIYIMYHGFDPTYHYGMILQEAAALFHMDYTNLYLDLSKIYDAGLKLSDIPDFQLEDENGNKVADADSKVVSFSELNVPALNIDAIWAARSSIVVMEHDALCNLAFDAEKYKHSMLAERAAEGLYLEYTYRTHNEPAAMEYWEQMGLLCEDHFINGMRWIAFVPKGILEEQEKKIPLMVTIQEAEMQNRHLPIMGMSHYYENIKLAATGEFVTIFFALESPDDNDILHEIILKATEMYPIDLDRVYLEGHSHNGYYAMEYMRRHPNEIAGVGQLGNCPGQNDPKYSSDTVKVDDEKLEIMKKIDMPVVVCDGCAEHGCTFPFGADAKNRRSERPYPVGAFEVRANSWQRRLYSSNCTMKTVEEIGQAVNSSNYVERMLGLPFDRTEIIYLDNVECYIGDLKNKDGNYHFRVVGIENQFHSTPPLLLDLAWSFLRRFKRNRETGEVIELY